MADKLPALATDHVLEAAAGLADIMEQTGKQGGCEKHGASSIRQSKKSKPLPTEPGRLCNYAEEKPECQ
jgi:hypothetical protein